MFAFVNTLFVIAMILFIISTVFLWRSAKMIRNGSKSSDEDVKKMDKKGLVGLLISVGIFVLSYFLSLLV
ncbi:hypothetical protein X927_07420 [Petrotoga mexicana DSM 14811]|jgi:hypothetical protein|uniref:Uncharacterized protein n=3 Tax=Petrotoga TaxID=28236 RepID=A0A2K1P7Q4_9BACT|nr:MULTISPECIES: hypothetical protein [Petrotoga]KUK16159.1 MAG: hypothetical protein XD53_0419 [Petrotoga mobilis]HBT50860.1 hypothetical protein [Petrotoga sp.]PNR93539.1 hypothetical protein X926_03195 [Petrotoga sp. HWHPT.55.6.3]PNR98832.1 hypothetical protein X927_07420 [Petrotoga mexicana DSM 14811]PNS02027.1 hypothetical protein X928_01370 [Petrotoga miotherma DSM 10691]